MILKLIAPGQNHPFVYARVSNPSNLSFTVHDGTTNQQIGLICPQMGTVFDMQDSLILDKNDFFLMVPNITYSEPPRAYARGFPLAAHASRVLASLGSSSSLR